MTKPAMTYVSIGSPDTDLGEIELESLFSGAIARVLSEVASLGPTAFGGAASTPRNGSVLILPPDGTRYHSKAGFLTDVAFKSLGSRVGAVMPALGTHIPMIPEELRRMFPGTPLSLFQPHDWRQDIVELGRLEAAFVERATEGCVNYDWPVQVNRSLRDGGFGLILSIGQVVPHEVVGMANHAKNLVVGTGGKEAIDKSHFAGAAYGMERMMGKTDTPVRALFDEGLRRFGSSLPPVLYALTVVGRRTRTEMEAARTNGAYATSPLAVRGLYVGFGRECFESAAALARKVNVDLLDEPVRKVVVYLEPEEFRTTWLGNKAVYRTRMAMADGGELLILAPGLERFGEDLGIDTLIRAHGYRPSAEIRARLGTHPELAGALSAAAHLIHGSSEGRFTIRYCPGPGVSKTEIESVGYEWGNLNEAIARYKPETLDTGWNTASDGERFFYIPNPALGLWASRSRFKD